MHWGRDNLAAILKKNNQAAFFLDNDFVMNIPQAIIRTNDAYMRH